MTIIRRKRSKSAAKAAYTAEVNRLYAIARGW